MWDLSFKLFKVRELREERRKQHDRSVEALDQIETRLKNPANTKEETESLTKAREEQEKYQKHIIGQIDALDTEINGQEASETQEKYNGILQQIEAHRELLNMYGDYMKRL